MQFEIENVETHNVSDETQTPAIWCKKVTYIQSNNESQ